LARPLAQSGAAASGQRVDAAATAARLLLGREVAGGGEAGRLLVGGGVRDVPEVLDRVLDFDLDVVGGRGAELVEQGEDRERGRGEADRLRVVGGLAFHHSKRIVRLVRWEESSTRRSWSAGAWRAVTRQSWRRG